jgi:parallel beta-helix repeat protein
MALSISFSSNNEGSSNFFSANWAAIVLEYSNLSRLMHNIVWRNIYGIIIPHSDNNTVSFNSVLDNSYYGIGLFSSKGHIISDNSLLYNPVGIWFSSSCNNKFYYNRFIGNSRQIYDEWWDRPSVAPSMNVWDNGYPSGGNYWSDYAGVDLYRGVHQNISGSDEIGDTPYVIDENNQDHYPLMKRYPPVVPTIEATVDIHPYALNLRRRGCWITAYIEFPQDYDVGDIDISTVRLNETISAMSKPTHIGDHDRDGIPDLMIKFDKVKVIQYILNSLNITRLKKIVEKRFMNITLTITGKLNDGTPFQGSHTIRIILKTPRFRFWKLLEHIVKMDATKIFRKCK